MLVKTVCLDARSRLPCFHRTRQNMTANTTRRGSRSFAADLATVKEPESVFIVASLLLFQIADDLFARLCFTENWIDLSFHVFLILLRRCGSRVLRHTDLVAPIISAA